MNVTEREALALVKKCQRVLEQAVALLTELHEKRIFDHCFRELGDKVMAEKVATQAFREVRPLLIEYTGEQLDVLLFTKVVKLCLQAKGNKSFTFDDDEAEEVGRLSQSDQTILRLRKLGFLWRQTAEILGIPPDTARKRGERAEQRLKAIQQRG